MIDLKKQMSEWKRKSEYNKQYNWIKKIYKFNKNSGVGLRFYGTDHLGRPGLVLGDAMRNNLPILMDSKSLEGKFTTYFQIASDVELARLAGFTIMPRNLRLRTFLIDDIIDEDEIKNGVLIFGSEKVETVAKERGYKIINGFVKKEDNNGVM